MRQGCSRLFCRSNSNQFEIVRQIAVTNFCRSDNDFHMSHEAICCSNLSQRRVAAICCIVCRVASCVSKWVDFVKSKRAHWEPTEHSAVCSEHFKEEDYTNRFADDLVRRLKRDEIGVCVFPTRHAPCVSSNNDADKPESERSKRRVRHFSASLSLLVRTSSFFFR